MAAKTADILEIGVSSKETVSVVSPLPVVTLHPCPFLVPDICAEAGTASLETLLRNFNIVGICITDSSLVVKDDASDAILAGCVYFDSVAELLTAHRSITLPVRCCVVAPVSGVPDEESQLFKKGLWLKIRLRLVNLMNNELYTIQIK